MSKADDILDEILSRPSTFDREAAQRAAYDRYRESLMKPYRKAFDRWLLTKEGEMPRHPLVYTYEFWVKEVERFGVRVSNCA